MANLSFIALSLLASTAAAGNSAAPAPLRIDGLVAAVFSPFDASGTLNTSVVPAQAAYLKATGVDWVFVGGTTGESLSLNMAERKTLTETWLRTSASVIAHVGADCVSDAQELARHAEKSGAKAIGAMPPVFFKPNDVEALAMTIATICGAAPSLPCYYYHIPSMTGVSLVMYDFVTAIEPLAPNFAGIKYTGLYTYPGFMDAGRVLNYKGGKYEVLSGREDMMLEALSLGIVGHVGSQFNFAGDLYNDIRNSFADEGLTKATAKSIRAKQMEAVTLIQAWQGASPAGANGNKYFMNLAGVPVGPGRLPSKPIGDDAKAGLKKALTTFCTTENPTGATGALKICAATAAAAAAAAAAAL